MSAIRYLFDENVDDSIRRGLHLHWPEVIAWRIGDPTAPPVGEPDPGILLWCEANAFSLVTNNRESMPQHLEDHLRSGHNVPGIFTLSPTLSIGEVIEELAMIWSASEPAEYSDRIHYLPLRR